MNWIKRIIADFCDTGCYWMLFGAFFGIGMLFFKIGKLHPDFWHYLLLRVGLGH